MTTFFRWKAFINNFVDYFFKAENSVGLLIFIKDVANFEMRGSGASRLEPEIFGLVV